jgi:hydroxymethylpyrimidine/phosphomethylpyrimidine kinase
MQKLKALQGGKTVACFNKGTSFVIKLVLKRFATHLLELLSVSTLNWSNAQILRQRAIASSCERINYADRRTWAF